MQSTAPPPSPVSSSAKGRKSYITWAIGTSAALSSGKPLAKARYIAQYFEAQTDQTAEPEVRYREVARGIGSRGPYIKRQLDGFAVYVHIEAAEFYEIDGLNEDSISFSLLSTAIGYEAILEYCSTTRHPFIEREGLRPDHIRSLTKWMYQPNENGETILGDSRNIQRLAVIASDDNALSVLTTSGNLKKAYALTRGVESDFHDLLKEIDWRMSEGSCHGSARRSQRSTSFFDF